MILYSPIKTLFPPLLLYFPSSFPLPTDCHQFVLYICESACFFFLIHQSVVFFQVPLRSDNHIVFAFLCLTFHLVQCPTSPSMLLKMAKFHSFLWLISILLYVVYVYTYTPHSFLIHSSVYGYLGCFHILAVVNNATMNIGMHVSF